MPPIALFVLLLAPGALAQTGPILDFRPEAPPAELVLKNGLKIAPHRGAGPVLEFLYPHQYAELPFSRKLDKLDELTISLWVLPRRSGEGCFLSRGLPACGANGERVFRPEKDWVNFLLGTDQHGFFMATIHGNGSMPFPFVTLNTVPIDSWSNLVVTKDKAGHHRFYINGTLVSSDESSCWAPVARPFIDTAGGEPIRLQMPAGGSMGPFTLWPAALSNEEISRQFKAGRQRYAPALAARPVLLREMDTHPEPDLWSRDGAALLAGSELTAKSWPAHRQRIVENLPKILGTPPAEVHDYYRRRDSDPGRPQTADLDPRVLSESDEGGYIRRKITIRVQEDDLMYAWLLVPRKPLAPRSPAVICFYGTTGGAGKDTTIGLSGPEPGTPPRKNRGFARDFVEAGFIVLAPDYLRDGQRIAPGDKPYDSTRFYKRYPDWSIHAKDAYDTSRAIDYLQSLDFVDPGAIAMVGHSYGGHSTIFATALDPRIKAAAASGPVSDFLHHGLHWASPRGARSSQSMPHLRPLVLAFHDMPADPIPAGPSTHRASRPAQWASQPAHRPAAEDCRLPVTFYEFTALIAPRPLLVFQAVGERRPMEEENAAAVQQVYRALGVPEAVKYLWHPGDHDFPPQARRAAVEWFRDHLWKSGGAK